MAQASTPQPTAVEPLNRKFNGCSSIRDYEIISKLGEGTFGEVHKARSRRTGAVVALKKILMHNEKDGFPITALREIKILKMLSHINILKLDEMAVERNRGEGRKRGVLYMVTPYMEHDLSGLLDNPDIRLTEPQIKCYMLQLLEGLRYLHDSHILHRDMKAANLLISNKGILQIADFGLARHYDEPVPQPGRGAGDAKRDYTALVVTRWYRPPELLLGLRRYTTAIDLWGAGCVFGEMFKRRPILAGKSDLGQIQMIFALVGSPSDANMPGWSSLPGCEGVKEFGQSRGNLAQVFREQGSSAISLLSDLLTLDWRRRITAVDALNHPYFKNDPKPARPGDLPRYQDSHELDRREGRGQKAALPPAPAGGTVGMGPNGDWAGPPPHGHMNGVPHANGDRRYRGAGSSQRLPDRYGSSGPPPRHDSRVPQNSHDSRGPPRRQAWQQHDSANPQRLPHPLPANPHHPEGNHQLPPRPENPPAYRQSNNRVDTYIPNYNGGDPSRRDDRQGRGGRDDRGPRDAEDRGRGGSRELDYGSLGNRPTDGPERRSGRDPPYQRDHRNGRSRSPPGRDQRSRDRDRERDAARDLYRR